MLDNGVIYHVCPRRECFSSFEKLDSGVVYMGDNRACQILRIGRIHIKMFDKTVRELYGGELTTSVDSTRLWHLGLCHSSIDLEMGAHTYNLTSSEHFDVSKKTNVNFDTSIPRKKGLLGGVHTNVWRPSKEASLEVLVVSNRMKKCEIGKKVKVLHFDFGRRYKRDLFLHLSRAHGILRHFGGTEILGQRDEMADFMESDAAPYWVEITLDHTVSFEIPAEVTQLGYHLDLGADDELVDSNAAGRYDLDMIISSPQVEVFNLFQFGTIGNTIICRTVGDIGKEL
ncbi:uncharacterized protein A4U43_C04F12500 [Asparagus officinalis]|uniref:Retrovirus-related Pol polyprotein from transposon TNT 1-94-like beta-barrel domain-containing protein n=1 Tax=Asparagus officinalis TaxID=4686 RepID=A0A5P1F4T5_ASPOF|nr:uncharacterized protein A4U43_C04F12500 [Asparagus officinalis]